MILLMFSSIVPGRVLPAVGLVDSVAAVVGVVVGSHTGSFALNAARGGAEHVTAVDVSASAIEMARANAVRNGLDDRMDFVVADVFDLLPELEAQGITNFINVKSNVLETLKYYLKEMGI